MKKVFYWFLLLPLACTTAPKEQSRLPAFDAFQKSSVGTEVIEVEDLRWLLTGKAYEQEVIRQIEGAKPGDSLDIHQFYVRNGEVLRHFHHALELALKRQVQIHLQLDFLFSLSCLKSFEDLRQDPHFQLEIINPPSAEFLQFITKAYGLRDPNQVIDQIIAADAEGLKKSLQGSVLAAALKQLPADATPEVVLSVVLKKVVEETSWWNMLKLKSGLEDLEKRSHDKLLVHHHSSAEEILIGGRGWADSFVTTSSPELTYVDLDVIFARKDKGLPAIAYFNHQTPEKSAEDFEKNWTALIDSAQKQLEIYTPYFVPSKPVMKALLRAAKRGIRIDVFTNSVTSSDVPIVAIFSYEHSLEWRQDMGENFHLHTFKGEPKVCFHAKWAVVDNELMWIGSGNLDLRSFLLDSNSFIAFDLKKDPRLKIEQEKILRQKEWSWQEWQEADFRQAGTRLRQQFGEKIINEALHSLNRKIVLDQL